MENERPNITKRCVISNLPLTFLVESLHFLEFNGTVVEGETLRKSIPVKKFSRNSTRENHLTWENIIEEALVHDNHYTVFAGEPEPEVHRNSRPCHLSSYIHRFSNVLKCRLLLFFNMKKHSRMSHVSQCRLLLSPTMSTKMPMKNP